MGLSCSKRRNKEKVEAPPYQLPSITVAQGMAALHIASDAVHCKDAAADAMQAVHLPYTDDRAHARRCILVAYPDLLQFEEWYIYLRKMHCYMTERESENQLNKLRLLFPIPVEGDMTVENMARAVTLHRIQRIM